MHPSSTLRSHGALSQLGDQVKIERAMTFAMALPRIDDKFYGKIPRSL